MSREKVQISSERPIYPTPAGLVTSVDAAGNPNIITLGEIYNLSIRQPVIVGLGIAPARYSHQLICECREFVVNLPRASMLDQVLACGRVSGRQHLDKFALAGLTPLPALRVRPPLIAECPINLECRLLGDPQTIGDHDLFQGEVLVEHVDADLLDESGALRTAELDMLIFARWTFWTAGKRLGEINHPVPSRWAEKDG
jgi:flavin reductase (DIM6/NTAB) family NADH-FMN oxidoreductase RutF